MKSYTSAVRKLGTASLLFVLGDVGAAAADTDETDRKVYPGEMCRMRTSNASEYRLWRGRFFNEASGNRSVHCPVVRDIVRAGSRTSLWMKVIDANRTADYSCTFWSQNVDSVDPFSGNVQSRMTSGNPPGVVTLSFPALSSFSMNAAKIIECRVPGRDVDASSIVAYGVTES